MTPLWPQRDMNDITEHTRCITAEERLFDRNHEVGNQLIPWLSVGSSSHIISAPRVHFISWWRHDMETNSALPALWEGNTKITRGFPSQRVSNADLLGSFVVRLNKLFNSMSVLSVGRLVVYATSHH